MKKLLTILFIFCSLKCAAQKIVIQNKKTGQYILCLTKRVQLTWNYFEALEFEKEEFPDVLKILNRKQKIYKIKILKR